MKDEDGEGFLVDKILDKTGMKGTGKWTVQQAAELSIAAPTIAASLDCRYLSGLKEERESAAAVLKEAGLSDELGRVSVSFYSFDSLTCCRSLVSCSFSFPCFA